MTWYALPDDNTAHAQVTQTFTLQMFTEIQSVTLAAIAAEHEALIGASGFTETYEIGFPSFTIEPSSLQSVVSWSNYLLTITDGSNSVTTLKDNEYNDYLTVDTTNEKLVFATTNLALTD